MLPFGLGNTIGWVTPFLVAFIGYTFMAHNEIVDEISEPFGMGENELPLGMMCDTIETQLAMLSEQQFARENKAVLPHNVVL
jgi:putative membrane protein